MAKPRCTFAPEFKAEAVRASSLSKATPSPRPLARSASTTTKSASGSKSSRPKAPKPSPVAAISPSSRKNCADSALTINVCSWGATS